MLRVFASQSHNIGLDRLELVRGEDTLRNVEYGIRPRILCGIAGAECSAIC